MNNLNGVIMLKILNKLTVDQYGTIRFLKQLLFQKKCKNKYKEVNNDFTRKKNSNNGSKK